MKKEFKEILKVSSDVMLYVASITLVVTLWFDNIILASAAICMSVLAIVCFILSLEEIKASNVFKDINTYYFPLLILIGISRIISSDNLFRIGLALFVLLTLVYAFFAFLKKEDKGIMEGKKDAKKTK